MTRKSTFALSLFAALIAAAPAFAHHVMGGRMPTAFMDGFLRHVTSGTNYATGETGTPTDFLSFHAKGRPTFVEGHVRMGIATHLREVDNGFTKVLSLPALAGKPVVIDGLIASH